ncbi:hypothetical protein FRACYDRAFT_270640 [Fragilariopsis cylindrus CCMP1102]|uniref:Uncharacterized protein n=1 Tax=Fragilariopsis cylindrus CCMP1102 TaxID=635003 RepID=A0A1E7F074_9STRA|nr:hypothetical protein FRACYDRAFT_270640 [Fragilariopsis cylindrus CCMP1102]|eukprot:OEU11602.1 hypothetical protein FRACYDRAFT_270640 [Fragilariopsis cylindrus CCMP1102]
MAAKEKQEKKAVPPPQTPSADLLMDFDAPATAKDPPPSYDTNFLKDAPPPAFDVMEQQQQQQQQFLPPPPIESVLPPPPPLDDILPPPPPEENHFMAMTTSAPAATAPMFEDLNSLGGEGGGHTQQQQQHYPSAMPPPMEASEQQQQPAELDIDESILNALEPAEREAFLEEQRQILVQIEKEKSNNETSGAAARAMAFDQRSSNAVANVAASYEGGGRTTSSSSSNSSRRSKPSTATSSSSNSNSRTVDLGGGSGEVAVHGSEKTQQAIEDGTAVIVKCMSCDNWMQVTEAAELMFCPICQVVCPVEKKGAATTADMEAAAQLAADAELAEMLQKEEYAGAQERRSRPRNTAQQQQQAQAQSGGEKDQSWYDWITGTPANAAAAPATRSSPSASVPSSSSRPRALVSAQTGEEARSYEGFGGGGGGARTAEQKSMFSCVADSINTAATSMTAYNLGVDEEGNVNGVNSEGLLAMPDVSRQREDN